MDITQLLQTDRIVVLTPVYRTKGIRTALIQCSIDGQEGTYTGVFQLDLISGEVYHTHRDYPAGTFQVLVGLLDAHLRDRVLGDPDFTEMPEEIALAMGLRG